jgi:allantoinase
MPFSSVTIRGGEIYDVSDKVPANNRYPVIDYQYAVISPGVIDVHVHMNEPGREHWEGKQDPCSRCSMGQPTHAAALLTLQTMRRSPEAL